MEEVTSNERPEFHQKLVFGWIGETPFLLKGARLEDRAGQKFLVGEIPTGFSRTDFAAGMTLAVNWSRIDGYYLFKTLTHYQEFAARAAQEFEKKGRWPFRRPS